jgi:hypothetical protein
MRRIFLFLLSRTGLTPLEGQLILILTAIAEVQFHIIKAKQRYKKRNARTAKLLYAIPLSNSGVIMHVTPEAVQ